jgi:hypothetical protein
MKYFAIIDDHGNHMETGTCQNNCDIVTALGRMPVTGERYVMGMGRDEETAEADSREAFPVTIE